MLTITAEQRGVDASVDTLTHSLADSAKEAINKALGKLTNDEIVKLATNNGVFYPARLIKIVMCAVVTTELVEKEFAADSVLKDIKNVRRKLKNRY